MHALSCLPNFTGIWLPDAPVTKPNLNHSLVLTYYCTFIFMHTFWGEGRQGRGKKSLNITYRLAPICPSHLTNLLSHIYILAPFSGGGGGKESGGKKSLNIQQNFMGFSYLRISWDWVKPYGLNPISRKKYLISNLIIYFQFLTEWWRTHSNVLA